MFPNIPCCIFNEFPRLEKQKKKKKKKKQKTKNKKTKIFLPFVVFVRYFNTVLGES
jgi:hypothetical protein